MLASSIHASWIYPIFILLAVITGAACASLLLKGEGARLRNLLPLLAAAAAAAVLGAKVFSGWERGGFVWWHPQWELTHGYRHPGGVLAAIAAIPILHRLMPTGISLSLLADALSPSACISMAVVRIGCFLIGCCHGIPIAAPWALRFPVQSPAWQAHVEREWIDVAAPASLAVHPLQLYFAVTSMILAVALLRQWRQRRVPGRIFFSFLAIDGATKMALEQLRLEQQVGLQVAAAGLAATGVAGVLATRRSAGNQPWPRTQRML